MRKQVLILWVASLLVLAVGARAQTVTGEVKLAWSAPTGTPAAKYTVYQATGTGAFAKVADVLPVAPSTVPATNYTVSGLAPGTYQFKVTASDSTWKIESPPSNTVTIPPPVGSPGLTATLTVTVTVP